MAQPCSKRHSGEQTEGANGGAETQHIVGEMRISAEKLDLEQTGA